MNSLKIKLLYPGALAPTRATEGDAGLDLYSSENTEVDYGKTVLVSTGIAVEIPLGYVGLVHPRSGLAAKYGVTVVNAPGTIDAGYRGEVKVILSKLDNQGGQSFRIKKGDRIAQLVIQKVELPEVEVVDELSDTARGAGGFGSTGS